MPKAASALLKIIPKDVLDFVLDFQNQKKKDSGRKQYGFSQALYEIVRDYKRCSMQEKTKQ